MARPAAWGRIVPARKFQAEISMSVVANSEPLFQLCMRCTKPETDNKKMPAITDPKGLCPSAASSEALSTQKAARIGANRPTTMSETKWSNVDSILATHALEILPPCGGSEMPCPANQDRNWGRVRRITDQNAQRWNRPPV